MSIEFFDVSLAALVGSLVLTISFYGIYRSEKKHFLLDWSKAWLFLSAGYFSVAVSALTGEHIFLSFGAEVLGLFHAVFLLRGTSKFIEKKFSPKWYWIISLIIIWIIVSHFFNDPDNNIIEFTFFAAVHFITGNLFLKSKNNGIGKYIAGTALILWSIHKLDYPFVHGIPVYTEYGYLFSQFLALLTGIGALIYFYEMNKRSLNVNEEKLRIIFEDSPVPMATSFKGIITNANQAYLNVFGYEFKNEIIGESILNQVASESREEIKQKIRRRDSGQSVESKYRAFGLRKDGTIFPFEVEVGRINLPEGESSIVFLKDITELKKYEEREEKLKKEKEKLLQDIQLQIEKMPIGYILQDTERKIEYMNPEAEKIFGFKKEELLGKDPLEYIVPEYELETVKSRIQKIEEEQTPVDGINANINKDGKLIYCEWRNSALYDMNGNLEHFLAMVSEVTDRIYSEKELAESEKKYRQLFEEDLTGHVVTNPNGEIVEFNTKLVELLGFDDKNDFAKRNFKEFYIDIKDREKIIEKIKKEGKAESFEINLKKKDGSIISFLENAIGKFDEQGNITQLRGYFFNINDRKRAEKELLKNNEHFELLYKLSNSKKISEKDLINTAINKVEELTESKLAYLHFLDESCSKFTNFNWSTNVKNLCSVEDKIVKYGINNIGAWSGCIQKREAVINNNASEIYKENNLPENHISLTRHMSIPVFDGNNLVAVAGVGNKTSEYTEEDSKRVTFFMSEIWKLLKHNREHKELYKMKQAVEQSPVSVIITDKDYNLEYVNSHFIQITGLKLEELKSKNIRILKSELMDEEEFRTVLRETKNGKTWSGEVKRRAKDGSLLWENVKISPIFNSFDEIINYLVIREDITDKKITELKLENYRLKLEEKVEERTKELQSSEERFRKIAEVSQDLIIKMDKHLRLVYINESVVKTFNRIYNEVINKQISEVLFDPDVKEKVLKSLNYVLENKCQLDVEIAHPEDTWIDYRVIPELENDEIKNIIIYGRDITKRKRLELQITEALKKEKEINEMKSGFVSMISHEFRTPLTALLSSVEILELYGRKWSKEEYSKHIEVIRKSVDNLTEMVNDVLMLNKTELGKGETNYERINIKELIADVVSHSRSTTNEKHRINYSYSDSRSYYYIDRLLTRNIISNLLSNSIKYSPEGGKIDIRLKENEKYLILEVEDDGIGIDSDDLPSIFEPFFRGKSRIGIKGTGLGLWIVKRSVEQMKGNLSIESRIDMGTLVRVKLPIVENER